MIKHVVLFLLLPFLGITGFSSPAHAKAYFAPKKEMIEKAEVIAVVDVQNVKKYNMKGKVWTYSEKARAKVEREIKGKLPAEIDLYGGESFICAQCRWAKGRYLVFLKKDEHLWTGSNWYLSIRPVREDGTVEWYIDDQGLELLPQKLHAVISEIENLVNPKL